MEPRNLTVLFLSGRYRGKKHAEDAAEPGPDPNLLGQYLAKLGITATGRRVNDPPLNPLARHGTFYAGFDPVRALQVLLFERHVDVVVSIGESNIVLILLLAKLLRFKPRIVLREISARGWRPRDRVVDFVLPRVDRVMVLTSHQKTWTEARYRLKEPPDLVGFAIDETFYTPRDSHADDAIVAVGDDAGRDYPCLIAACQTLPYRLVLRTDNRHVIPENLLDRVTVLGRLSNIALRDLYAAAAIVVVPLRQVDHPSGITTLFEAMAMGRAIVASDIGSMREFIQHDISGILVPAGDPAALNAAILRLMGNTALRQRLGKAARMRLEEQFSYRAYVGRFVTSLESVLRDAKTDSGTGLS